MASHVEGGRYGPMEGKNNHRAHWRVRPYGGRLPEVVVGDRLSAGTGGGRDGRGDKGGSTSVLALVPRHSTTSAH
jgi:hypothetical protein